jgi:hypothetical protein
MACWTVSLKWMCLLAGALGDTVPDVGTEGIGLSLAGISSGGPRWLKSDWVRPRNGLFIRLRRYGREKLRSAFATEAACATSDAEDNDFRSITSEAVLFLRIGFLSVGRVAIMLSANAFF